MEAIGTVIIGKLIEAHYEKDEIKFKAYVEHIADALKEQGDERGERIIRSKIDGSYANKSKAIVLDNKENVKCRCHCCKKIMNYKDKKDFLLYDLGIRLYLCNECYAKALGRKGG